MRVELISHTLDPERTVAAAARLCYSASDIPSLRESIDEEQAAHLIDKILKLGHLSVLEHASFTFGIEGISRACSHQLVRHRMASFSQQSQRYVNMNGASFCIPSSVIENEEALSKFTNVSDKIQECYSAMVEAGIPAEDARYVLPNAVETKVVMTANARSLMNFFEIRLCSRAQWEIRELAGKMRDAVLPIAPNIFKHAGPTCETQEYCREGTMTCGRLG